MPVNNLDSYPTHARTHGVWIGEQYYSKLLTMRVKQQGSPEFNSLRKPYTYVNVTITCRGFLANFFKLDALNKLDHINCLFLCNRIYFNR
jgi:hypothetical protein